MIELVQQQFTKGMSLERREFVAREFLQVLMLKILQEKKFFDHIAFIGGTALRILYRTRRFSEDLDFSLVQPAGYDFERMIEELRKGSLRHGFPVEIKSRQVGNVVSLQLRFPGLLKELGLSPLASQKMMIKLEVALRPPQKWKLATTTIQREFIFSVVHFDLPSLFAGKVNALLCRKYTKGRDIYDLVWYLTRGVVPNFRMLMNGIEQVKGEAVVVNDGNWKELVRKGLQRIDFEIARRDVRRFLEDPQELSLIEQDVLSRLLA